MEDEFDCVKEVGRFWKLSPNVRLPYLGEKERVLNNNKKITAKFHTTAGLNIAHEDTALLITMILALTRKYLQGRGFTIHVQPLKVFFQKPKWIVLSLFGTFSSPVPSSLLYFFQ